MPFHEAILGAIGAVAGPIATILGGGGTKGPTRADWARVRLMEAQAANAERIAMAQRSVAISAAPLTTVRPYVSRQQVLPVPPHLQVPGIDISRPSVVKGALMVQNGLTEDQVTFGKLMLAAWGGAPDETLREIARQGRFSRRDFIKLTADNVALRRSVGALGANWLSAGFQQTLFLLIDKVNDALKAKKRRSRIPSMRSMQRSFKAWGKIKTLAKKAGVGLKAPECPM